MKYLIIVIILLISFAIWFSPNFFEKDTFYNGVDSVFPFSPQDYFKVSIYSWNIQDPFGYPNLISNTFPVALVVYILSFLKIPLWIMNRLWLLLPSFLTGISMCYLYRSLFRERYSYLGCLIAASYIMLIPFQLPPLWQIGMIGNMMTLGAIFRLVYFNSEERFKYSVIAAIGISLTLIVVRFTAIVMLFIALFIALLLIIRGYKKLVIHKKTLVILFVMFLLINAYILVPAVGTFIESNSSEFASSEGVLQTRSSYIQGYHEMGVGTPLFVFRLLGHKGNGMGIYFSNPLIKALTLFFPIYAFIPFLFVSYKKEREKAIIISLLAAAAMVLSTVAYFGLTTKIYAFLSGKIGLFITLVDPNYCLVFFPIFLAVLLGVSTEILWKHFDGLKLSQFRVTRYKSISFAFLFTLIIFVHGKSFILPERIPLLTQNHIPYVKIPKEYYDLRDYLKNNIKIGERILTLPWVKESYVVYKWWPDLHMPDIVNRLTYLPTIGDSGGNMSLFPEIIKFNDSPYLISNFSWLKNKLKVASVRYVIIHRDYSEEKSIGSMAYGKNSGLLIKKLMDEAFKEKWLGLVLENEYFVMFEYKDM